MTLVQSENNKADCLSRVPAERLPATAEEEHPGLCGAVVGAGDTSETDDGSCNDDVGEDGAVDGEDGQQVAMRDVLVHASYSGVQSFVCLFVFCSEGDSAGVTLKEVRIVVP